MSGRLRNFGGSCSCLYDVGLEGCVLDKKWYRVIFINNMVDMIDDRVDYFFVNGVVIMSIVVGCIFFVVD